MPFEVPTETVFVDMKLTSLGRQLASLGRMNFAKVIFSDAEIDYRFESQQTDLGNGFVISPPSDMTLAPGTGNLDGTPPIALTSANLSRGLERSETHWDDFVFFNSGSTGFRIDTSLCIASGHTMASNCLGTNQLTINYFSGASEADGVGQLVLIRYSAPVGATMDPRGDLPFVSLWYRINEWDTGTVYTLDRAMPNFATGSDEIPFFIYPWSGVSYYSSSASTADTRIWNMNIVRSINEIGSSGASSYYTTYGSVEYNGFKHLLNLDQNERAIGIIHDSNSDIKSDIWDRLQISSTTLYMPTLMWHRKPEFQAGLATTGGHSFTDRKSLLHYDNNAQLYYSNLMDGTDGAAFNVGRVYHDIRTIVITDPELLNAMTYLSNRNWTLPKLNVSMEDNYFDNYSGLCEANRTYLVSYQMTSDATYSTASTFSYRDPIHCGYISKAESLSISEGSPKLLVARFGNSWFPYMRSTNKITSFSGTGWNANDFNILVKEIDTSAFSGIGRTESTGWKKLSGSGSYPPAGGETTISSSGISSYSFILTRDAYLAATDHVLVPPHGIMTDRSMSGLSYGDETFFFGAIKYDLNRSPEKVGIHIPLMPQQMNSTKNYTFNSERNDSTYITCLYILDANDRLVAMAKPSSPIKKNYSRFLEFKLELIIS